MKGDIGCAIFKRVTYVQSAFCTVWGIPQHPPSFLPRYSTKRVGFSNAYISSVQSHTESLPLCLALRDGVRDQCLCTNFRADDSRYCYRSLKQAPFTALLADTSHVFLAYVFTCRKKGEVDMGQPMRVPIWVVHHSCPKYHGKDRSPTPGKKT